MPKFDRLCRLFMLSLASLCGLANAQSGHTLQEVVEKTILTNPEILAQFQTLQSALEEQNIGKGALRPEINLQAQVGREWRNKVPDTPSYDWRRQGYTLELTQLLFDGFATLNGIRQLSFEKVAKYYEMLATTDDLATAAINAYLDVQRYREMIELATDNYEIHHHTLKLLEARQASGVGRGVDYNQAEGRFALAQTNLMTETNNLNDVAQRYRRIVGELPPAQLAKAPDVANHIPLKPTDFLPSLSNNPTILSKQALLQAADSARAAARGRFSPTIQLRGGTGTDRELPGETSRDVQSTNIKLVLSYNLYRGGADSARLRQSAAQRYAALDVRDYTCRNTRQELALAWNNMARLHQQIPFLQRHQEAMAKVRIAAEQQFQIGQRSLLDLLDTSNELFDARRALLNGRYDLQQQQYRWLALSHRLLPALGIAPPDSGAPDEAKHLQLSATTLAECSSDVPNTDNLKPASIAYSDDLSPPTLSPASARPESTLPRQTTTGPQQGRERP